MTTEILDKATESRKSNGYDLLLNYLIINISKMEDNENKWRLQVELWMYNSIKDKSDIKKEVSLTHNN